MTTYSTEELLAETGASGRLHADWQSLGLLSRGIRPGRGQGLGRERARFPEGQRLVFRECFSRRQRGDSIPSLCNLPVAAWLLGAVDVPTRQAGRAIRTWAASSNRLSRRRAREEAQALVDELADSDAEPVHVRRATRALAAFLYERVPVGDKAEQLWDELLAPAAQPAALRDALRRVHDPSGRESLSLGDPRPTPTAAISELALRYEGLYQLDDMSERDFERARLMWQLETGHSVTSAARLLEQAFSEPFATHACEIVLEHVPRPSPQSHRTRGLTRKRPASREGAVVRRRAR